VFQFILDKKERFLPCNEKEENPISTKNIQALQGDEKEESSVYPSVGKTRPPFSLGKGKRSCLSPLPLEKKWKRA